MKKQIILGTLLIVLALALGLTGSALAANGGIEPRTANSSMDSIIDPHSDENSATLENDQAYGTSLPTNNQQGITIEEELKNIASVKEHDNRGVVVTIVIVITIVIIAALVMWWYKTNY